MRIIFKHPKTSASEPLLRSINALNIFQINIFQTVQFMHKIKNKNAPRVFQDLFSVPCHAYPTNFSLSNFLVPRTALKSSRFAISTRGPYLWNTCLTKREKEIDNFLLFKHRSKEKILELSTATNLFQ